MPPHTTRTISSPAFCLLWLIQHAVESLVLSAPEVVKATSRSSVTVSCQYDLKFKENTKYWCKGKIYEFCNIVVKTPKNRSNDRSFIVDDKEAGVFTVTMKSLRQSDEDQYWCVIATSGRNIFTGVKLFISQAVTTPTNSTPIQDEISSWVTLRWILFILMLCCLASTHVAVWRIKTPMII
ncbi:CMRF35-like molecule 3 isoform X2 [Archocentrus centrarchus]|uniref:CMRF35-like molecule 3 isoform X2 n=1 Tax=Archocentrus centrarchus TaxID=63155 RepID=UPI0011E9E137|nr:CMRF35-like molecule 3 isoform X2 [Archocentrus centrarchus]